MEFLAAFLGVLAGTALGAALMAHKWMKMARQYRNEAEAQAKIAAGFAASALAVAIPNGRRSVRPPSVQAVVIPKIIARAMHEPDKPPPLVFPVEAPPADELADLYRSAGIRRAP